MVGVFTQLARVEGLGEAILEADAPVGIRSGGELFVGRFAHDTDVEFGDGHVDALDIGGLDAVARAQTKNGINVRMQDVGGGKRLERGVAAIPAITQVAGDAAEVLGDLGVLQVRCKEAEAPLEDQGRAGDTGLGEKGGRKCRLCAAQPGCGNLTCVPSTQHSRQASGKAADDARSSRERFGLEGEHFSGEISDAEGREESGGVKATAMELPDGNAADARGNFVPESDGENQSSLPETGMISERAMAAATDGLDMWTIDSLLVSSNSWAWEKDPLAKAAVVTPTLSPVPRMRQGPGGDMTMAAARVARPILVSPPPRDKPMVSSTRSFVASTTSWGKSSNTISETHFASSVERGTLKRSSYTGDVGCCRQPRCVNEPTSRHRSAKWRR